MLFDKHAQAKLRDAWLKRFPSRILIDRDDDVADGGIHCERIRRRREESFAETVQNSRRAGPYDGGHQKGATGQMLLKPLNGLAQITLLNHLLAPLLP